MNGCAYPGCKAQAAGNGLCADHADKLLQSGMGNEFRVGQLQLSTAETGFELRVDTIRVLLSSEQAVGMARFVLAQLSDTAKAALAVATAAQAT